MKKLVFDLTGHQNPGLKHILLCRSISFWIEHGQPCQTVLWNALNPLLCGSLKNVSQIMHLYFQMLPYYEMFFFLSMQCHMVHLLKIITKFDHTIPSSTILSAKTKMKFYFFIFLIWVLRHIKMISLISSRVNRKVGGKWEICEINHLTTRKQNLACLTCDPSWAGLEPTVVRWRAI